MLHMLLIFVYEILAPLSLAKNFLLATNLLELEHHYILAEFAQSLFDVRSNKYLV
jgi:hypothetical protein